MSKFFFWKVYSSIYIFSNPKEKYTIGDAVLEIKAKFSLSFFVSFLEELKDKEESKIRSKYWDLD